MKPYTPSLQSTSMLIKVRERIQLILHNLKNRSLVDIDCGYLFT